jgi:hypothetical protein
VGFKHGARPLRHYTGSVVLLFSSSPAADQTSERHSPDLRSEPTPPLPPPHSHSCPQTHISVFGDRGDGGSLALPADVSPSSAHHQSASLLSSALGLCGLVFLSFVFYRLLIASCCSSPGPHHRCRSQGPHHCYFQLPASDHRRAERSPLLPAKLAPPASSLPHPYEEIK